MEKKSRKKKILTSVLAAAAALLIALAAWTVWGNVTVGVTRRTVKSDRLPAAFNGYKIALVSDVHNAEFGKNNSRLLALIKQEAPDMIAITGDLIDPRKNDLRKAQTLVRGLTEIAPCYYVTGNNEALLVGEEYAALEKVLLDAGVTVLRDRAAELVKNGESVWLAGLDDPDFTDRNTAVQKDMLQTRLRRLEPPEGYRILLSHRPETFEAYAAEGIDLAFTGHTHGGQFRLPFIGGIAAPNQGLFPKYDAGVFTKNSTTMIVSRGIGNSVIPVRFNNRPEIVLVTLQCG